MQMNTEPIDCGMPSFNALKAGSVRLLLEDTEMFHAGMPPNGALVHKVCSPVVSRYWLISSAMPLCISISCCLTSLPWSTGLKYTKVMAAKTRMAAMMLMTFLFRWKKLFFISVLEKVLDEAASVSKELAIGGRDGKESDFWIFVLDEGVDKDHQAIGGNGKDPPPAMEDGQQKQ